MLKLSKEYLAGFIDGEGTITVRKIKKTGTKSGVAFRVVVRASNCNLEILETIKEEYGGWISKINLDKQRQKTYEWRQCYLWEGTNKVAKKLILDIKDHLIIKKKQAELCLRITELCDIAKKRFKPGGGFAGATKEEIEEKDNIYNQIQLIHKKKLL